MTRFQDYLCALENRVLIPWAEALGRVELVPVRNGKLARTRFGKTVRTSFVSDKSLAIDYYGLFKKSSSLVEELRSLSGKQVRMIEATTIHFAAISIEQVAKLSPELVAYFPIFKEELLRIRGFMG